jgi:hypothetical protein
MVSCRTFSFSYLHLYIDQYSAHFYYSGQENAKMEATRSSETSADFCKTTRRGIPDNNLPHIQLPAWSPCTSLPFTSFDGRFKTVDKVTDRCVPLQLFLSQWPHFSLTCVSKNVSHWREFVRTRISKRLQTLTQNLSPVPADIRVCATLGNVPVVRHTWTVVRNCLKVKVTLRSTVSQSVCLGAQPNLGLLARVCVLLEISFRQLQVCNFVAPSLTRVRVCYGYCK